MDKFPEAFKRFEQEIDLSEVKDRGDITRKFSYWQTRDMTHKQKEALWQIAEDKGIIPIERKPEPRPRRKGVSEIKGIPREELRRHYTAHKVRGKMQRVARIPKGKKGAGQFA